MREQLKLLEELQRYDVRIQELEAARKAIPKKIGDMKEDLRRMEDLAGRERAELEATETWRRDQESDMKSEEQQLLKAKAKLTQVRTSKEYMATQREVETTRKQAQEAEEKLLKVMEAAETARARIAEHAQNVEHLRELVAKEEEAGGKELAEVERELETARGGRGRLTKSVQPDVLKKYESIARRRGLAVVAVHDGTCSGCHMNVPPQIYNMLQRGSTLELCPNCHRIVYWDKLVEEPAGEPPKDG